MKDFEEKRKELDQLRAPQDFEVRLRAKLNEVPPKKKRMAPWLIAVAILCIAFTTINYPALAFYGKTLFGYEELMNESIRQLNEEGYGQQINKSIELEDGTVITIEGIMSDLNQFELYYSIEGDGDEVFNEMLFSELTGLFTHASSDSGIFDTSINKGVQRFESVSAFAKKLTLEFQYKQQNYTLQFPYDANKAVPTTIKKQLNKNFTYDFGTIKFKALYATKGTTRLEGTLKETTDRKISYDFSQVVLVADGKELTMHGSGLKSTFYSKYQFSIDYDVLPADLKKLAIEIRQFNGMDNVKQSIPTQVGTYTLGPVMLDILSVQVEDGKTKIRIASDDDVMFDQVSIETKKGITPLVNTESYSDGTEKKERTLVFNTTDEVQKLYVENIYYNKRYSKLINIPVK
jgi:hypothetical protein